MAKIKPSDKQYTRITDVNGIKKDVILTDWSELTVRSVMDKLHFMFLTGIKDNATGKLYATFVCMEETADDVYAVKVNDNMYTTKEGNNESK